MKKPINKCDKCNRIFYRKNSLNRHIPICKIKLLKQNCLIEKINLKSEYLCSISIFKIIK